MFAVERYGVSMTMFSQPMSSPRIWMRVGQLVGMAVSAAKHSSSSRILEIGCGPGTATVAFAQLGCAMVCLEPNPNFCAMATMN
jgi:16S rRNA A1518/A1519 N6-dimethyltransferase RsmA/KsgA/DIM1 with predicted DNA glycosylase/AP lyase activity